MRINGTVAGARVNTFLCPSSPAPRRVLLDTSLGAVAPGNSDFASVGSGLEYSGQQTANLPNGIGLFPPKVCKTVRALAVAFRKQPGTKPRRDERSKELQDRGVEVVYGDLLDIGHVRSALCGVQRAYFVYPIKPGIVLATAQFAQAAIEVGVDGIVNMSQKTARENAKSHAMPHHWLAERVFDWSGLTVAHIRPTLFAEWLLYVAPMIKAGQLHVPFGTGRHAPIAAEDMGRVIAGILEDPAPHKGGIHPLFGPVEYSYRETAEVLSRVLGRSVEYKQVGFEEFRQTRQAAGKASAGSRSARTFSANSERTLEQQAGDDFLFQHLAEVAIDHQNGILAGKNDKVEKLSGRPPMTLEAFIEKHRAAFE